MYEILVPNKNSSNKKAPTGTIIAAIESKDKFIGEANHFITDGTEVYLNAKQTISATKWRDFSFRFNAAIKVGYNKYEKDGDLLSISYNESEDLGNGFIKLTSYPAVYSSGGVNVIVNLIDGAFLASFGFSVQNNPSQPILAVTGEIDVKGLEEVSK